MSVTLRPGTPGDAEAAGVICHDAFEAISVAHGFPPDFPSREAAIGFMSQVLPRPDVFSVVADIGGRVAGSNFLWEDGPLASVGPITVDPALQNASLGRRLMQAVLDRARARGIHAVRLVQAAYHARSMSLYTKLGFVTREPLALLRGGPLASRIDGYAVRAAAAADLDAADDVCRRVHGHARSIELRVAQQQGGAAVVLHDGRITGYTTGIGFFGHAVGETNEDVKALIAAAPAFAGSGLLVPTRNAALFRWCLEQGLRVVQPMTLMSLGPYNEPHGAFLPSILC